MITSTKLNVPVVTLSVNNCYEIKSKDLIFWKKYTSKTTTQTKNNNLSYLIDLTLLIDFLFFISKMVMMILQEIPLMSITCR